jgi:hypothetical protein
MTARLVATSGALYAVLLVGGDDFLNPASEVGDTGFEPVTSSVSAKVRLPGTLRLSVTSVRLGTYSTGQDRTDW